MKLTIALLFTFIAVAIGGTSFDFSNTKGWLVPQIDGGFKWMTREQYDMEVASIEPRAVQVKFYLYTKSNPTTPKQITVNDANALAASNFNKNNPTRFVIHGWNNNYLSDVNVDVRSALLASGSYNVFCVDWSSSAQTINYASARYDVPNVGQLVANFIDFLNDKGGMPFSTLGLIGHSLGAHVSGYAGKLVKRGKVNTIVGLDPALPLFSYSDCSTRLCTTDASYVESIQTNGGTLGFLEPIGKGAFYPNGGKTQPGCGVDLTGSCAHSRSYIYYSEALRKNDFPCMKCGTYTAAVGNQCGSTYSSVRMGAPSNYGVSGYFYVPVNSAAPYGKGS
ncbi:phospholipase A1 VesT1.02-like [Musca vetustissima]|uniref:phospholipase A1 VesT1.02-like n=1 Tax=Musca vetustissima TaxID=27455 RepID=UPI002AB7ED26|nr:phospholipase A1 VesT1.02-like [Musca vetustissima]